MAKPSHKKPKTEMSGKGVGEYSRADINRRANELALIDNRTEANDQDRARAMAEFQSMPLPDAINEDADSMQSMSRDPSDPMVDRGHQVREHAYDSDPKMAVEKLALEGVEEAQHEQMLEARNFVDEPLRSRPKRRKP